MEHQALGQWDDRPSDPAYYIEDCRISIFLAYFWRSRWCALATWTCWLIWRKFPPIKWGWSFLCILWKFPTRNPVYLVEFFKNNFFSSSYWPYSRKSMNFIIFPLTPVFSNLFKDQAKKSVEAITKTGPWCEQGCRNVKNINGEKSTYVVGPCLS